MLGAARFLLRLPGRGAGPARGRRPAGRGPPGPQSGSAAVIRSKGRDGCRVPLPWTRTGPSFGFGSTAGWLPQPPDFGELSAEAQDGTDGSTLELYRAALALRGRLLGDESLEWDDAEGGAEQGVLHFERSGGWHVVTNLSAGPRPLPDGEVLLSSSPVTGGELPVDTTVWLRRD